MKRFLHVAFCTGIFIAAVAPAWAQSAAPLKTEEEQDSYAMGQEIGTSIQMLDADVNVRALLLGIQDVLENKPPRMSQKDIINARNRGRSSTMKKREKKLKELKNKHAKPSKAFLAKNRKAKGVVTTKSGLQYTVLSKGSGPKPGATSRVQFHYKGTLIDGTEFDSSFAREMPEVRRVDQAIPGWTEALQLMEVGSKYRFVIPAELAFGDHGIPGKVAPGAAVIYEISLLGIEK